MVLKQSNRWRTNTYLLLVGALVFSGLATAYGQTTVSMPNGDFENTQDDGQGNIVPDIRPWQGSGASGANVQYVQDVIASPSVNNGTFCMAISYGQSITHPKVELQGAASLTNFVLSFEYCGPRAILDIALFTANADAEIVTIRVDQSSLDQFRSYDNVNLKYTGKRSVNDVAALKISVRSILDVRYITKPVYVDNFILTGVGTRSWKKPEPVEAEPAQQTPSDAVLAFLGISDPSLFQTSRRPEPQNDRLIVTIDPPTLVVNQDNLLKNYSRINVTVMKGDGSPLEILSKDQREGLKSKIDVDVVGNSSLVQLSMYSPSGSPNDQNQLSNQDWPFDLERDEGEREALYLRATRVEDANIQLRIRHTRTVSFTDPDTGESKEIDLDIARVVPISIRRDPNAAASGYSNYAGQQSRQPPRDRAPDERLNRQFREKY